MGFTTFNLLKKYIDYDKLRLNIKDFSLLIKVIEHLENILMTEITTFHLCTIIYTKEDLDRLLDKGGKKGR